MKKFSKSTSAVLAQHPRAMARLVLAFVASVLVVLLALMGMSSGPNGAMVFAQATESPTPTAGPAGPKIALLNPSPAYNPELEPTGELPDPPKISDKYDGVDRAYHVVARTALAPSNSVIEAYWQPSVGLEVTIGTLSRVPTRPETWEMFWEIPESLSEGSGQFIVRMFQQTAVGFEQVAEDKVDAELRHKGTYAGGDPQPEEETVEITWPSQDGELGFYKPKGGFWRGVVEGLASGPETVGARSAGGAQRIYLFYSTTPAGEQPEFTRCGFVNPGSTREDGSVPWMVDCTLAGKTLPSDVTAIAAVAAEVDQAARTGLLTQESADVHVIRPYAQEVERMTVSLEGVGSGGSAAYPSSRRRVAASGCLLFDAVVTDHLGRPVQGANLDVHLQGPNDQVGFGSDFRTSSSSADSAIKDPDKGTHQKEPNRYCDDDLETPGDDRGSEGQEMQGEHNVPGGADVKHIESVVGSGLDSTSSSTVAYRYGPGVFRFSIFSFVAGFSDVTVWVDDEPIASQDATREADDDIFETGEASATIRAQWLPSAMSISFSPRADSAPVGECNRYTVRARAGSAVVPGINVDVHAQGPNNDLDFCDPGDGTPRRAPDKPEGDSAHQTEDEGESSHKSDSPDQPEVQHTEGETDADGNFVIGITSTATGSTQLSAWADGEKGQDNDVRGSSEPTGSASKSWAATAADAEVRFVNPSGYGGSGDRIADTRDADERYHLVARVDLPDVVPGVEFFIGGGETFTKIGDGVRVADSDTWELFWDVNVPDGTYTLRAQIIGTTKREDRSVTVRNQNSATDPRIVLFQTAELTRPLNAGAAPFADGATRIEGVASARAEGVELYYTMTGARETRDSAAWKRCGSISLKRGDAPQNFDGACTLATGDVPLDVTGIAALAFICDPATGCISSPESGRIRHSGDAHRVFGFEANPSIVLEPSEASGKAGDCKVFEARVVDSAGRAIPNANVDVHMSLPGDTGGFCDVEGGSARRTPDRGGHAASPTGEEEGIHQQEGDDTAHTEGETNDGGRFIFGVTSPNPGDSSLVAWVDQNDNDENGPDERSASGVMHFTGSGNSGCTISGDSGNNTLRGTDGDDVICGFGGKDTIHGLGGNDVIRGGKGHDDLRGNAGNDEIYGGGGLDILRGGRGTDVLRGNSQDDVIRGYIGNDRLIGGNGDDTLRGGDGRDTLKGNVGNDTLNGGRGSDRCRGGRGRDITRNCER